MRTSPAFGEQQDLQALSSSGRLKLLYMSHLALGDYIYQGAFLKALTHSYPNIQLDVWIDDCRSKKKSWHAGRSQALVQWLSSEPHINYIYPMANNSSDLEDIVHQAHTEDYDVIVFVATSRTAEFAKTALSICDQGKVFGTIPPNKFGRLINYSIYKKLDGKINLHKTIEYDHISDFYQDIFQQFFAVSVNQSQRVLKLNISHTLKDQCTKKIDSWAIKHHLSRPKIIFVNHLSTSPKRDWKLCQLEELILLMGDKFPQSLFILNAPPNEFQSLKYWADNNPRVKNLAIKVFTANNDFFELPCLISLCSLVITVETSIMHLASSLNIQQIALIRQSAKHWRPQNNCLVLQGNQRVDNIEAQEVFSAVVGL